MNGRDGGGGNKLLQWGPLTQNNIVEQLSHLLRNDELVSK